MCWTHVNIIKKLTIKKSIINIKLRDGPLLNICHNNKSVNSGHMSNRSKSLIIITTVFLLKPMGHKLSYIVLKISIRVGLSLIDHLQVIE
jgi:hypothetical protein